MTTTTMRPARAVGVPHGGDETVHRPDGEPIFTELSHQWRTAGRLVPGQRDEEWTMLVRRLPWPGG
ncbi:hypothetical protein ACGFYY_05895 [Streptomyces sp. NPDC048331]|uniref:hypothetical protein n=1 Tax=unclassified Streptomyces TaxID=2593676 RepID=UPI003441EFEA